MFYTPKEVINWDDQIWKWVAAGIYIITPLSFMVFTNNLFWYLWD